MTVNLPAIHACPIKQLYLMNQQRNLPSGSVAVLCTMNKLTIEKLLGITYLHIPFSDLTNELSPHTFTIAEAHRVHKFVESNVGVSNIYFCCDSGESRSTALAAATMHYLGQDEMVIWKNTHYHPNPLVYYLQCQAYELQITRDDALELAAYNKHLFERQLRLTKNI